MACCGFKGIEPIGAIEHAPSLVGKRIWIPKYDDQVDDEKQAALEDTISSAK